MPVGDEQPAARGMLGASQIKKGSLQLVWQRTVLCCVRVNKKTSPNLLVTPRCWNSVAGAPLADLCKL